MKPKLSIIIVNWNTQALLKQCVDSITGEYHKYQKYHPTMSFGLRGAGKYHRQGNIEPTIEIIIVDNGSTDGSAEYLRSITSTKSTTGTKSITGITNIKIIENKENLGFAKANNQGIKAATEDYIMLLNSDTIVKPDALAQLVDYLDNHPNTVVSPGLMLPNGQPQNDYYMKFPNIWQIILYHHPLFRLLAIKLNTTRNLLFNASTNDNFPVDQLPGAALVASKDVWEKVGGLDESYKFFFEDVDWSWRAMHKGIKRVVVSGAEIIHLGGSSWKQKINKNTSLVYQQFFSSMLLFCQKNYLPHEYQLMRWAVVINMVITFKFGLAWYFIKTPTKQTNLW